MALITNTDTSIAPYNTVYMVYDLTRQMYVLTDKGVLAYVGKNLVELAGNINKAEVIRYEVSQDIMNYIAMYSLNNAYKYKNWLMAKDFDLRVLIERVLADQMRYYIRSGAGVIKDMHGVAIEKGKAMDLNSLRGNVLVSASVDIQLKNSGLLYTGHMHYSDYTDDGTW